MRIDPRLSTIGDAADPRLNATCKARSLIPDALLWRIRSGLDSWGNGWESLWGDRSATLLLLLLLLNLLLPLHLQQKLFGSFRIRLADLLSLIVRCLLVGSIRLRCGIVCEVITVGVGILRIRLGLHRHWLILRLHWLRGRARRGRISARFRCEDQPIQLFWMGLRSQHHVIEVRPIQ